MCMPEAPVDKNHFVILWQNQIWLTWHIFWIPLIYPASKHFKTFTSTLFMPEPPVAKNHCVILWQNQIWLPWQIFCIQPVTKTTCVQELTHNHLGFRILA